MKGYTYTREKESVFIFLPCGNDEAFEVKRVRHSTRKRKIVLSSWAVDIVNRFCGIMPLLEENPVLYQRPEYKNPALEME